ncbi:MAG TPA: hypothetical protein VMS77_02100 [Conexivisphaerales archaeon]|nr:hypothetical protein [Conexivisphaerales archaeon]
MTQEEDKAARELKEKALKGLTTLLYQRHFQPGLKGWELKRLLGRNYVDVLRLTDALASDLGLKLVAVPDEDDEKDPDKARYVLVTKAPLRDREMGGWLRMEEAASLAIMLSQLFLRAGSAPRKPLEDSIKEKLPAWRVQQIMNKLVRLGYLEEDGDFIKVGWRSKVEIDRDELLTSILSKQAEPSREAT